MGFGHIGSTNKYFAANHLQSFQVMVLTDSILITIRNFNKSLLKFNKKKKRRQRYDIWYATKERGHMKTEGDLQLWPCLHEQRYLKTLVEIKKKKKGGGWPISELLESCERLWGEGASDLLSCEPESVSYCKLPLLRNLSCAPSWWMQYYCC